MTDTGEPNKKTWPDCCNECSHEWQSKALIPDSNELLNIFLMILGGLTVLYGLFYYFPDMFAFLGTIVNEPAMQTFMGVLGSSMIILGAFALLAGIGMFQEQEWAWGMALMVLVFIIANTLTTVIATLTGGTFDWGNIGMWLQLVSLVIAVIGIPWLLATKARYR